MKTGNVLLAALTLAAPVTSGCDNCDDLRAESKALVQEYAECNEGDTCKLVDMYELLGPNNCLGTFQCSKAMRTKADVSQFQERALIIVEDYEVCGMCEQAGCASPATLQARCNTTTHQCEAYTIDALVDAGVAD